MSNERRGKLEAYAHGEEAKTEHSTTTVSDKSLTKERLALQEDIRTGCLGRLDNLIVKINGGDFADSDSLSGLLSDLSYDNIFDYRDQYTTQTYEALWQKIREVKIALENKGIYYDKEIQIKLNELDAKLEKNRLRVVYIFDPIILRTQIFDDFRNKVKQLRESGATKEEIQELKDKTREKLILSIELLSHLQLSFSQAYQELFPRLAEKIQDETTPENPYPQLDVLDVVHNLQTGLVDYGITTNIHRNNIIDHLELLTDSHNYISSYLESFPKPLDGKEFFRIYTAHYLGQEIEPTGEIYLISEPPYRDLTFEFETDEDYFVVQNRKQNGDKDKSSGRNYSGLKIPNGSGEMITLPVSIIRGLSEFSMTRHEDAHSLQSQYQKSDEGESVDLEMIASNREKWVPVFNITYEEAHSDDFDKYDWRKKSQVYLAKSLNKAILRARGEIQAYTRDGTDIQDMTDFLTETGDDALYDYLDSDKVADWMEAKLGDVDGFDASLVAGDIVEARANYSSFLSDALGVVDNYLRLLGDSHDIRETASIIIRFTTIDELKWLVNLLQERRPEALTYDPSEKVVEVLAEIDESLSYEFVKSLANWGKEIEKVKSLGFNEKSFGYLIGHMRWNNFRSAGASVKALSNPESVVIVDKPTTTLKLKSKEQFMTLCKLLGLIGPDQKLEDMVKNLDINESVKNGYQHEGRVIHNVPTNITGLSISANLEGYADGSIDVSLNFDLETFHLMLNQMGFHC